MKKEYRKRSKKVVNIPSILSAAITGATGGIVIGSALGSIPGAVIGGVLGTAITGATACNINFEKPNKKK